ncbi:hypothetical protein EA748_14340 [Acinetobacter ursingii]|nr:hypothetical protein EA748_14340 [Acinetobacter ursingii]
MPTHNVFSYAKRIDEICLGELWQSISKLMLFTKSVAIQRFITDFPKTSYYLYKSCVNTHCSMLVSS